MAIPLGVSDLSPVNSHMALIKEIVPNAKTWGLSSTRVKQIQSHWFADILYGKKAGDIQPQGVSKTELYVNPEAAKSMGSRFQKT